jgi:hypothetical protein
MLLLIHLIVDIFTFQLENINKSICIIILFSLNYYFNIKCENAPPPPLT